MGKKQKKTEKEDLKEVVEEIKQKFGEGAIMKLTHWFNFFRFSPWSRRDSTG